MDRQTVLFRLGWSAQRQSQLEDLEAASWIPARVSGQHRGRYDLLGCPVATAHLAGRSRHQGAAAPAVGDWVAVEPTPGLGVIHQVLPRASVLERKRPGVEQPQIVAANVDVVFVVASAEHAPNLRRIERTLAIVAAGGARPVVVLNKVDLSAEPSSGFGELGASLPGTACLATSAVSGLGIAELRAFLPVGTTGALLGPSGSGKSSLINALLGRTRMATGAVRASDGKGRHTTTRRELIELPDGGCLIDTPGMRELGLWDAGDGIERTFSDVTALAAQCRFRDCRHRGEPGCVVAAALEAGTLAADRLASFEKLRREDEFQERRTDPHAAADNKGRWKSIHRQQRARRLVDPKLREE